MDEQRLVIDSQQTLHFPLWRGNRASERNFTREYEDRHRAPLFSWALIETCI